MFRVLLITAVALAMLGACTQHANYDASRDSSYRHGGVGPPFSSRILP
jgi:hypothetical protein